MRFSLLLIGIDGGQIAHPFAGDVYRAVFDRIVVLGLTAIGRSEPRRKATKIFSVEWPDHLLVWLDRQRWLVAPDRQPQHAQGTQQPETNQMTLHDCDRLSLCLTGRLDS